MGLEIIMRTLLLAAALSATTALAAEATAPAGRSGGNESTQRPSPRKKVPTQQKLSRMEKTRLDVKDNEVGAPAEKVKVETEPAIPESIPAAEPPHVALRGVRG